MATNYPKAEFTGIDISPIQPSQVKPGNFTFIQANLFDGLPFPNDSFDFVFQRFLVGAIHKDKWPFVVNELTRVLKPGGYLEVKNARILSLICYLGTNICSLINQLVESDSFPENLGPNSTKLANACMNFFFIYFFFLIFIIAFMYYIDI